MNVGLSPCCVRPIPQPIGHAEDEIKDTVRPEGLLSRGYRHPPPQKLTCATQATGPELFWWLHLRKHPAYGKQSSQAGRFRS